MTGDVAAHRAALQLNAAHRAALQLNAAHRAALQLNAAHRAALQLNAAHRAALQHQALDFTLVGPVLGPRNKPSADGVISHIQPLLLVRL